MPQDELEKGFQIEAELSGINPQQLYNVLLHTNNVALQCAQDWMAKGRRSMQGARERDKFRWAAVDSMSHEEFHHFSTIDAVAQTSTVSMKGELRKGEWHTYGYQQPKTNLCPEAEFFSAVGPGLFGRGKPEDFPSPEQLNPRDIWKVKPKQICVDELSQGDLEIAIDSLEEVCAKPIPVRTPWASKSRMQELSLFLREALEEKKRAG